MVLFSFPGTVKARGSVGDRLLESITPFSGHQNCCIVFDQTDRALDYGVDYFADPSAAEGKSMLTEFIAN